MRYDRVFVSKIRSSFIRKEKLLFYFLILSHQYFLVEVGRKFFCPYDFYIIFSVGVEQYSTRPPQKILLKYITYLFDRLEMIKIASQFIRKEINSNSDNLSAEVKAWQMINSNIQDSQWLIVDNLDEEIDLEQIKKRLSSMVIHEIILI